jgi:hypothetical protein
MDGGLPDKPFLQTEVILQDNILKKMASKNACHLYAKFKQKMMILKIINSVLILVAVFMGFKQGYAMFSAKPEMLEMFSKFGFGKNAVMINGAITILSAVLILFPKTFVWGNFLMAAGILMIICLELLHKDLKGAAIELPFLLLNLLIIYLQHPLKSA